MLTFFKNCTITTVLRILCSKTDFFIPIKSVKFYPKAMSLTLVTLVKFNFQSRPPLDYSAHCILDVCMFIGVFKIII